MGLIFTPNIRVWNNPCVMNKVQNSTMKLESKILCCKCWSHCHWHESWRWLHGWVYLPPLLYFTVNMLQLVFSLQAIMKRISLSLKMTIKYYRILYWLLCSTKAYKRAQNLKQSKYFAGRLLIRGSDVLVFRD